MARRILNIAWKELLHLAKDRLLVPFFFFGALFELVFIGWATGQPIQNIDMTVVDRDQSEASAALIAELDASDELAYARDAESIQSIYDLMADDQTVVGISIPENYGEALAAGDQPTIDVILNGAQWLSATTAEFATEQLILEAGMRERFGWEPEDYADELPVVTVRYNEDLVRSHYTLPAEMAFMFYMMSMILAAVGIVRERERGTYEQLRVMPYRSWEVIIGKILPPMAISYGLFLAMLGVTTLIFGVPVRGSLPLLLGLAVVYLGAEMGKGILLSLATRTQLQAVLLAVVVAMVDMIFSGYAVAVETMPQAVQTLANFFAIRHWLIIVRDIMLKGVGLEIFWPHVIAIVAIGAVITLVTVRQYRRNVA